nr:titin isoform X3 [Drosophila virilis]
MAADATAVGAAAAAATTTTTGDSPQSSPGQQLNSSVDSGIVIAETDTQALKLRQRLQQCQRILQLLQRDQPTYQQLRDRLSKIAVKKKKANASSEQHSCNVCCADLDLSSAKNYVTCCTCGKHVCRGIKCADWLPKAAQWVCELCHSSKQSLEQTSSWVAEQMSFNQQKFVYPLRARSEIYIPISAEMADSSMHFESVSQVGANSVTLMNMDERSRIREYVEEIVAEMLGGNLDHIKVGQLSKSENYLQLFDKYHAKLSNLLINVENTLCARAFKGDLPAIVNGNNNNNNSNSNNNNSINNEQLADISQTRLRSLIETIIAETLRSGSNSLLLNPPSGAVSEISLDTRSNGQLPGFSNGGSNSKRRHRTEHYFEPKIYQDLLATAVLNKIADKEGNNRLISESTPDLSAHNIDENYNAEALSTTSGSSIEPRSDCSLTDHELVHNTGKAEAHAGSQLDVERESVLSDYIAAHMVPLPDFSASVTESEDDVVSMSSSLVGDGTWEDNWLFKKKRSTLQSSATPSSIGMLVPAPKENVRAQIGDRTADEVSDLSEMGSDAEESSLDLLRCNELNDRLLSKHLIGGQNTKLVLDELVDRTSLTSNTLPAEHEPAFTETTNPLVQQPTVATVPQPEEQKTSSTLMAPPPPMIFQDDEITEDPAQTLIAAAQCDSDELCDLEGLTGFGDVEYLDDSKLHENIPSVIEILAAIALGPMLAVPASEQPAVMTATEIHTLKELSDLALAEINARTMELAQHSLDIIEEEFTEAQSADQVDKSQTAVEEHKHMSPVNASEIPSTTTEEISQPKEGNVEVVGQTELSPNEHPISGETPTAAPLINEIASAGLNSETKLVPQEDLAQLVTQAEVIVEPQTAAPAPTITQATEEVTLTAAATEPPTQQLEVSSPLAAGTVASEEAPVPTAEIATLDAHEEDTTLTGETAAPVEIPEPVIELFSPTEKPTTSEAPEDVIVTLDEISAASGNITEPAAEIVTPAEGTIAPEVDPASAEEHAAQPTASEIVSPAEVTATSEEPSWPAAEIVILDTPEEVPTLTGETAAPVEISEPVIELFTPAEKPVTSEPPADVTASSTEESSIPEKVPTPAVKKVAPSEVTAAPDEVPLPTVEIVSPATVTAPEVFPAPAAEIVIAAEGTAAPGEVPAPTDEIVNVVEQTAASEESPVPAVEIVTPAEVTASEEVTVPAVKIVTPAEVTASQEVTVPAAEIVTLAEVTAAPEESPTAAVEKVTPAEVTAAPEEVPVPASEIVTPAEVTASEEVPAPAVEIVTPAEVTASQEVTVPAAEIVTPAEVTAPDEPPAPALKILTPSKVTPSEEVPVPAVEIVTPAEVTASQEVTVPADEIVTPAEVTAAPEESPTPAVEIVTPAEVTAAPEEVPVPAAEIVTPSEVTPSEEVPVPAVEIVTPAEVTASEEVTVPAAEIVTPAEVTAAPEESPTAAVEKVTPAEVTAAPEEVPVPASEIVTPAEVTASEEVPAPAVEIVTPAEVTAAPEEVPVPAAEIVTPAEVTAPDEPPAPALKILTPSKVTPSEEVPVPAVEIVTPAEVTASQEVTVPADEIVTPAEVTAAPEESPTAAVEKVTPAEVTAAPEEVPEPAAEIVTPAEVTASEDVPEPALEIVTPAEVTAAPEEVPVPASEIVTPAEVTAAPEESPTAAVEKVTPAEVTAAPEEVPVPASEIVTPAEVTASEEVPAPAVEIVTPAEVTAAPEEIPVSASEIVTPAEVTAAPEESLAPAVEIVTPTEVTLSEEVPVPAVEIVTPAEVTASQKVLVPAAEIVTPAEGNVAPEEVPVPAEVPVSEESQAPAVEIVTPAEVTAAPEEVPEPAIGIVTPEEVTASEEVPVPAAEIVTPEEVAASQESPAPAVEIVTSAEGNVAAEVDPAPTEEPAAHATASEIVILAEVNAASEESSTPAAAIGTFTRVTIAHEAAPVTEDKVIAAAGAVTTASEEIPNSAVEEVAGSEVTSLSQAAREDGRVPAINEVARAEDSLEPQVEPKEAAVEEASAAVPQAVLEDAPAPIIKMEASLITIEEGISTEPQVVTNEAHDTPEEGPVPIEDVASTEPKTAHEEVAARPIENVASTEITPGPQINFEKISASAINEVTSTDPQTTIEEASAPATEEVGSAEITLELQVDSGKAPTPEIEKVASTESKTAAEEDPAQSIEGVGSTEITQGLQVDPGEAPAPAIEEVASTEPQPDPEEGPGVEEIPSSELAPHDTPDEAPTPASDDVALTEMILDKPAAPATEEVVNTDPQPAPEEDPAPTIEEVGSAEITQGPQVKPEQALAPAIKEVVITDPQTTLEEASAPTTEEVVSSEPQAASEKDSAVDENPTAEIATERLATSQEVPLSEVKELASTPAIEKLPSTEIILDEAPAPVAKEVASAEPQTALKEDSTPTVEEVTGAEIATEQQAILHEAPAPEGYEVDYTQAQVTSDQDPAIVIEEVARAEVTSELQQTAVPRIVEAVSSVEPQAALEDASISAIEEVASTETIQEPQVVPGEAQEPAIKEVSLVGNKSELPDAPVEDVPGIEKVANAEIIIPQQEVETPALGNVPPAGVSTKPQADLMEGGFEEVSAVPQVASEEAAATIATDILILEAGDETQADLLTSESVKSDNCALGSIAEREVRKWSNAVEMPNNPYAPEALKQRISGTQERFMDVPNISACAEQKALAMMRGSDEEPASRVEDYKRYSRDYYINNAPQVTTPTSARAASVACSSTEEPASAQTDEDIVINEAQKASKTAAEQAQLVEIPDDKCIYTALPAQVLEAGCNASLETQSNQSLQTTSDDSDTVRVYDFNKQETTVIKAQEQQPSTSSTSSMESALSAPSSSSSIDASRKRERPVVLQFGPADATPNVCASPTMTPTRGSTPPAFRFLQPKRRLIEPSQVLSIDDDDEMPEPAATPTEKPAVEDDVVHALPSVKALAQAFLLTSKRTQPERRWRAKTLQNAKLRASPDASEQPTSPQSRKHMLQRAVSIAEVADESTIASDLSSLETDPSMQSEENAMNIPIASPASPVPVRRGFLRSNIAYFENLKFK